MSSCPRLREEPKNPNPNEVFEDVEKKRFVGRRFEENVIGKVFVERAGIRASEPAWKKKNFESF